MSDRVEWFDRAGGEPVVLRQTNEELIGAAREWIERIRLALPRSLAYIEHIGSTAVPGLLAKPVIDLQVAVPVVSDEASYRPALESLGLVLRQREPDHLFFRPPAGQPRTVHVHVCQHGSVWEQEHLRFRNLLRSDPRLAAAYEELKKTLARNVGTDRVAYTNGKTEFIRAALSSAAASSADDSDPPETILGRSFKPPIGDGRRRSFVLAAPQPC